MSIKWGLCRRCKMTLEEDGNITGITPLELELPPFEKPMIHPCVDPPVCRNCQKLETFFFDPECPDCRDILSNPNTTVPEIFAILRQWTPNTQQNIELLVTEILARGASINDRDGLTDMTLLHYASKSGAAGIGYADLAAKAVSFLLSEGADVNIRCRWTTMTALHYATYFDVAPVIKLLLKATDALDIDSPCAEFDQGTVLHIGASNLAHEAIEVLLLNGANPNLRDDLNRLPIDCVPDSDSFDNTTDMSKIATSKLAMKVKKTLQDAISVSPKQPPNYDLIQSKVTLQALGLKLGDKIVVGGTKAGTLQYCGPTEFASGVWAGIELEEGVGKNDGSVAGISYFKCPQDRGIFAPINKISKPGAAHVIYRSSNGSPLRSLPKSAVVKVDHVTAKIDTGLSKSRAGSIGDLGDIVIEERVIVAGQRKGTVKFVGDTKFASGTWYGIELDKPVGKNDGSVSGVRYFSCQPRHGVFAPLSRIQKLGDKSFSSNESLETISWGAVSERQDRKSLGSFTSSTPKTKSPKTPKSSSLKTISRTPGSSPSLKLEVNMSVLCNNELGIIRYIGPTEFGEGMWLGVELRTAKGKNDGSVQGKRYFTCRPDHGLIVRPSRVSARGINGAKLMGGSNSPTPESHSNSNSPDRF